MEKRIIDISTEDDLVKNFNPETGLIVDIRSIKDTSVEGLENAVAVDLMSQYFMEFFYDVKKDTPILLYCDDGSRSKIAGRILSEMGYENLFHLKKGINQWERKVF
jgi:rhodanese-related sulfurtransferase